MFRATAALSAGLLIAAAGFAQADSRPVLPRLQKPLKIEAKGKPIDVSGGHAAPLVFDWDKDGRRDLLVGEFGENGGKLRIYLNRGTRTAPKFDDFVYLQAGGDHATVPSS